MNIAISKIWPGWTVTDRLGHGGFGQVYKATYAETDAVSTVKVISIPDNNDITCYESLKIIHSDLSYSTESKGQVYPPVFFH